VDIPSDVTVEFNPPSSRYAMLQKAKAYWDGRRGRRRMPARSDLRPAEMTPWLSQVLLADVLTDSADFRYRLIGTRLDPYFPVFATGKRFTEALAPFGERTVQGTLAVYQLIVTERAPALISGPGEYFAQESKPFEAMLMPLGDDDAIVTMIFGAFEFDWKRDLHSWTKYR